MSARAGRPPGPTDDTRERVLQAAFRLLATEGPHEVTPLRIHRETGVARTTVYRHWPTPGHVLGDILTAAVARHELDDLVGDLHTDLPTAVHTLTFRFENRPVRTMFRATLEYGPDESGVPMSERYITGLIAPVRDVLADALERGQLEADDIDELTSELCGPLMLDHLLLERPVNLPRVDRRITAFLTRHAP